MQPILKSASSVHLISGRSARMSSFAIEFLCSGGGNQTFKLRCFWPFQQDSYRGKNGSPCLCSSNSCTKWYRSTQGQTDTAPKFITAKGIFYRLPELCVDLQVQTAKGSQCYSRGKAKLSPCQIVPSISLSATQMLSDGSRRPLSALHSIQAWLDENGHTK